MEKKITYREFQKQDAAYVANIIKETWNYDRSLPHPKPLKKLSMLASIAVFLTRLTHGLLLKIIFQSASLWEKTLLPINVRSITV